MNQDQARRKLPDLAADELSEVDRWLVHRHLERSPALQREWQEIRTLYADIRRISEVTPGRPAPTWPAIPTGEATADGRGANDWAGPPPGRRHFALPALALTVVLTLCCLPPTGWLVRRQLRSLAAEGVVALVRPESETDRQAAYTNAVRRDPENLTLRIGAVLMRPNEADNHWTHLQKILPAPERQRATILALLLNAAPASVATETEGETRRKTPGGTPAPKRENDPALVRQCLAYSEAGETADPENAFFPLMRAAFLLSDRRRDEAMAALRRAGARDRFHDYAPEAVRAKWAVSMAAHGETGVVSRLAVGSTTLYAYTARIRALARAANAEAIRLESTGKRAEGFAIRFALLRIARKMQRDGSTILAGLVGSAVGAIAINRPDGEPEVRPEDVAEAGTGRPSPIGMTAEVSRRLDALRLRRFDAYVKRVGTAEARYAAHQARVISGWRQDAQGWLAFGFDGDTFNTGLPGMSGYLMLFGTSFVLLFAAIWTLLLFVVAAQLVRTEPVRRGLRMPPGVAQGFALLTAVPVFLFGAATMDTYGVFLVPAGFVLAGLCLFLAGRSPQTGGRRSEGVSAGFGAPTNRFLPFRTVMITLAVALIGGLLMTGPIVFLRDLSVLLPAPPDTGDAVRTVLEIIRVPSILASAGLAFPALGLLVLALVSYRRRLPVSVGMVRGFYRIGLPLAGVLLLLYAGAVVSVAVRDRELRDRLGEMVRDEPAFFRERSQANSPKR
ncbi:MAG: hypothetical protein SFU56_10350 [Capsulimonadales bacterium]|nr:hypothetical protein [Capsulimonadales bacterium]